MSPGLLDRALPEFEFSEEHEQHIAAEPPVVWRAFGDVKPLEVRLLTPLMTFRSLPSLLTLQSPLPGRLPDTLLEAFLDSGFVQLGERPGREFAAGAVGRFWRPVGNRPLRIASAAEFVDFHEPGYAKGAVSFTFQPEDGGTLVRTETRVAGTDPGAVRAFGRYWRLIQPGSALIRVSWLNAIRRRALRAPARRAVPA